MRRLTPIKWYGSKNRLVEPLLTLLPPHDTYDTYDEVFGGSAALFLAKPPSRKEIYNDIDRDLVNYFRVVRDPVLVQQLIRQLELTPYSRREYADCKVGLEAITDPVELARRFHVLCDQSMNNRFRGSWSRDKRVNLARKFHEDLWLVEQG